MAVAFAENQQADVYEMNVTNSLSGVGGKPGQGYQAMSEGLSVRRLTPTECERLQGFPDGFTQIPWRNKEPEKCPDGPRYKALGNSMAVPVMKWIGERIQAVEAMSDG
jgi:DNA (cytosine-5)-methyltransferase 1